MLSIIEHLGFLSLMSKPCYHGDTQGTLGREKRKGRDRERKEREKEGGKKEISCIVCFLNYSV